MQFSIQDLIFDWQDPKTDSFPKQFILNKTHFGKEITFIPANEHFKYAKVFTLTDTDSDKLDEYKGENSHVNPSF